jgi:glycosyltransferase involved in cell wall biosynthesis
LPLGVQIPSLIPNAQDQVRQILQIPDRFPILLFMSRIHPKKGLEYLIEALGKLKEYNFSLVIAGSGELDYVQQLQDLLVTQGISDRTYLVGFVKGETKNLYLQGADLFTLTSHSENFGVAAIEALAAGTPVLITDGVAIAPMVKEQAIGYVTKLEVNAIVTALENFFQNFDNDLSSRQKTQQIIAENYSWQSISAQLVTIYQAIVNEFIALA